MPLILAQDGHEQTIKAIRGNDKTKSHLCSLGFCVGAKITLISQSHGNVILKIKDSRIALSSSMASRIMV